MKITRSWRGATVSVAEAIEGSLDVSDHGTGQLEDLNGGLREASRMLGVLVAKLHAKGILSDAEIKELVGWKYAVDMEAAE